MHALVAKTLALEKLDSWPMLVVCVPRVTIHGVVGWHLCSI